MTVNMIQDDYGNLVSTPGQASITARLDEGDARMTRIEQDLADNTLATQQTAASTSELVELLQTFKGAFKVFEYIGKLAKPLAAILSVVAAAAGVWAAVKAGTHK